MAKPNYTYTNAGTIAALITHYVHFATTDPNDTGAETLFDAVDQALGALAADVTIAGEVAQQNDSGELTERLERAITAAIKATVMDFVHESESAD